MTSDWREIPMSDIDWRALNKTLGRSARLFWRFSQCAPAQNSAEYGRGCWDGLTLGDVADKGAREILRHTGVGPVALDALQNIINMAGNGTLPLISVAAPDALRPQVPRCDDAAGPEGK